MRGDAHGVDTQARRQLQDASLGPTSVDDVHFGLHVMLTLVWHKTQQRLFQLAFGLCSRDAAAAFIVGVYGAWEVSFMNMHQMHQAALFHD